MPNAFKIADMEDPVDQNEAAKESEFVFHTDIHGHKRYVRRSFREEWRNWGLPDATQKLLLVLMAAVLVVVGLCVIAGLWWLRHWFMWRNA